VVHEIDERIGAHGEVLTPLDLAQTRREIEAAYARGLRACAVVRMHGYRYPQHERQLTAMAREAVRAGPAAPPRAKPRRVALFQADGYGAADGD
jgi:N-methylhydantoinase A/oxoprolinase/acetone carboxylase beta subunit